MLVSINTNPQGYMIFKKFAIRKKTANNPGESYSPFLAAVSIKNAGSGLSRGPLSMENVSGLQPLGQLGEVDQVRFLAEQHENVVVLEHEVRGRGADHGNARDGKDFTASLGRLGPPRGVR